MIFSLLVSTQVCSPTQWMLAFPLLKQQFLVRGTPELKLPFRGRGGHPVRPAFDSTRWPSDAIPQRRDQPIRAGSAAVCVVAWIRTQRAVHLGSVSKWNCHYSADILALRILPRHSMTFSDVWARMTPVSLTLLKTHQTWKQRHFCRRPW